VNKTATIKSESLSLDERIATALASPPTASAELLELLAEINAAVEDADEEARISRERSVDPRNLDGEALFEKADRATFWANRLNRSLSEIQALYGKAIEAEHAAQYRSDFDRLHVVRDNLADELKSRYPAVVTELVELFGRITKCNQEIDQIHADAPEGSGYRLRHVEGAARGLDVPDSVLANIRLPDLRIGQHGESLAYPPPAPSAIMQMMGFAGGMPDAEDDQHYETVLDEATGYYIAKRRADAPPLPWSAEPAPVPVSMREQALAEQAARAEERERLAREGQERDRAREAANAIEI
jgi:hypothetical protein